MPLSWRYTPSQVGWGRGRGMPAGLFLAVGIASGIAELMLIAGGFVFHGDEKIIERIAQFQQRQMRLQTKPQAGGVFTEQIVHLHRQLLRLVEREDLRPIRSGPSPAASRTCRPAHAGSSTRNCGSRLPRFRSVNDRDGNRSRYATRRLIGLPGAESLARNPGKSSCSTSSRRNQYCLL